jgi:hypothetical protein
MKRVYIIIASSIFVLASVSSACKKNKDSLLPPPPQVPQLPQQSLIVNAGPDRGIVLPRDSVSLSGTAVSVGALFVSYQWTKIHGPAQGVIVSPNAASTLLTGLVAGSYEFEFTVTDNNGNVAADRVFVGVFDPPGDDPCTACWDY